MLLGIFLNQSQKKKKKRPPYVHTMGHCSHLSLQLPTWHWLISWKKNPQDREPNRYIFANNQGLVCLWYQILAYRKLPTAQFVHYFLNTRGLKLCMPLFHSWILNWSCCATLPQLRQQVQQVWGISKATADYCRTLAWKKWVSADNFKPSDCSSAWGLCCPRLWTG